MEKENIISRQQAIDIEITSPGQVVDIETFTSYDHDEVTGIYLFSPVIFKNTGSRLGLFINNEEILPLNFRVSAIFNNYRFTPNECIYGFREKAGGSKLRYVYQDTDSGSQAYPYTICLMLHSVKFLGEKPASPGESNKVQVFDYSIRDGQTVFLTENILNEYDRATGILMICNNQDSTDAVGDSIINLTIGGKEVLPRNFNARLICTTANNGMEDVLWEIDEPASGAPLGGSIMNNSGSDLQVSVIILCKQHRL